MCCLFGFVDYKNCLSSGQKHHLLKVLGTACEARGTDATGIAYNTEGQLRIYKKAVPAHKLRMRLPHDVQVVMGHTRFTTQGSEKKNHNNHPFRGTLPDQCFALAHNGVLHNDHFLRQTLDLPDTPIETDSYIAVQLIEKEKSLHLQSLRTMAEQVEGSFVFTALDAQDSLYFVRGDNPLCIYHYPSLGLYIYASTEGILQTALSRLKFRLPKPVTIDTDCGDILEIDRHGHLSMTTFDCGHLYQFYPRYYGCFPMTYSAKDTSYLQELKNIATAFGYTPEDIDDLAKSGISPEEIEDYFYCGAEL
ncbi:class II glutamine amidotransferase [Bengtsoniella intestinalis]|uniref:class II glutamine amidotransferase n=1 Tax=Bengtsoniella intestinalis TaxID=3073143 RepID=UPI00391F7F48